MHLLQSKQSQLALRPTHSVRTLAYFLSNPIYTRASPDVPDVRGTRRIWRPGRNYLHIAFSESVRCDIGTIGRFGIHLCLGIFGWAILLPVSCRDFHRAVVKIIELLITHCCCTSLAYRSMAFQPIKFLFDLRWTVCYRSCTWTPWPIVSTIPCRVGSGMLCTYLVDICLTRLQGSTALLYSIFLPVSSRTDRRTKFCLRVLSIDCLCLLNPTTTTPPALPPLTLAAALLSENKLKSRSE